MADVFISYAREDRLAAERIAAALGRHGWSVWWDANIPPGKTWDELIERELVSASCAVVLWSAASLARPWVKTEAADALARGVLVPVLIENVTPPIAFRHVQAAPLMDWRNDLEHAGFQQLLCSVCALAGLPARPGPEDVGRAFRLGRMRGKGAIVSARTGRTATLSTAPLAPAAKPAPTAARNDNRSAEPDVGKAGGGLGRGRQPQAQCTRARPRRACSSDGNRGVRRQRCPRLVACSARGRRRSRVQRTRRHGGPRRPVLVPVKSGAAVGPLFKVT